MHVLEAEEADTMTESGQNGGNDSNSRWVDFGESRRYIGPYHSNTWKHILFLQ
jgi:hypothetical protein